MSKEYQVERATTETFIATCKKCQKPFRSDDRTKAINKVTNHLRDAHK